MNQKGFVNIIFIIVVVVLAGVAGYFALTREQRPVTQQTTTPPPGTTQTPTPQTVTPVPADETADWKTYRNAKYGFEFKYPSKYFLHSDNTNVNFSTGQPALSLERYSQPGREGGGFVILKIFSNSSRVGILDWLKTEGRGKTSFFSITINNKFGYEDYTSVKVDGSDGITINLSGGSFEDAGTKANETIFSRGPFIFYFRASYFDTEKELEQDADKILSTFKFIK